MPATAKTLDQMRPRKRARVKATHLTGASGELLSEMGVCAGEQLEVRHLAPVLRDPMAVRIGGGRTIVIRRRLARFIEVDELT